MDGEDYIVPYLPASEGHYALTYKDEWQAKLIALYVGERFIDKDYN